MLWNRFTTPMALLAAILCFTPAQAEPTRVLLIGNSYLSYSGGVANHLARMAAADPAQNSEPRFIARTIGNSRIDEHEIDGYLAEAAVVGFDIAILQEHSTSSQTAETRARFLHAIRQASALIRKAGASVALYMTPAYRPPHARADPAQTSQLHAVYAMAGDIVSAPVIPVGLAFATAYKRRPDIGLHDRLDGSHPTLAGSYLAAATVYASLYGRAPPPGGYDADGRLSAELTQFLLTIAAETALAGAAPNLANTN